MDTLRPFISTSDIHIMRSVIMTDKTQKQPKYKSIPKQVSRKDFNKYILPQRIWRQIQIML